MEDKKREFEEEMSNTFIGEINQKSAIAMHSLFFHTRPENLLFLHSSATSKVSC